MIQVGSKIKLNDVKSGTNKKGQKYWKAYISDFAFIDNKLTPQGIINILCNGNPIANDGDYVYVYEIISASLKKYRNKQGAWSTFYNLVLRCGTTPIKNKEGNNDII